MWHVLNLYMVLSTDLIQDFIQNIISLVEVIQITKQVISMSQALQKQQISQDKLLIEQTYTRNLSKTITDNENTFCVTLPKSIVT